MGVFIRDVAKKNLFLLFLALIVPLLGDDLKIKDIRPTMDEMLVYHVEFRELNPLVIRRSFKVFVDQFDPEKIYFLKSEITPFLEIGDPEAKKVIANFNTDSFPRYEQLNQLVVHSIKRARGWREEYERQIILSKDDEEHSRGESYFQYTASESQLKERIRRQLLRFLSIEKHLNNISVWTPEKKKRVFDLLERRLRRVENTYLETGGKGEHYLALHVLKSLAKSLDAHSAYFSPEEAYEMRASLEKQFEGIGVVLREGIEGVVIVDLVKGSPAEKCGKIASGDLLTHINGKPLANVAYEDVLIAMKGDGKKEIELKALRKNVKGDQSYSVRLSREKIVMQDERLQFAYEPFADGWIAKLSLPSFYESSDESSCELDMRSAIKELKKKGKLYGMVLDLRENSGGFLNQAVKVAGLFISSGVIVISKYAKGEVHYLRDVDGRSYFHGPLIILTSKGSASAAEIVAQALQDYGAALIVGDERTYGKGTIQYQTVTDDQAKTFFKVTVGKYYTVSGKSTQIEGVKADVVVPTQYAYINIGERFLEYPLKNDRVPAAFVDPLSDMDPTRKQWFQRNYLPYLQQKLFKWRAMLPVLRKNSKYRMDKSPNMKAFVQFLENPESIDTFSLRNPWGSEDVTLTESIRVLKDMIYMDIISSKEPPQESAQ